ncbi:hypothetical protein LZ31DRAFT_207956 [Colletotrichum somersetense]|nr:hypothetical protein LZ31DRAFT_207956 [Colletotrichum somersetense]
MTLTNPRLRFASGAHTRGAHVHEYEISIHKHQFPLRHLHSMNNCATSVSPKKHRAVGPADGPRVTSPEESAARPSARGDMPTCVYNEWAPRGNCERIRNLQAFPASGFVCTASESCLVRAPFARCHNGDAGPRFLPTPNFQKQNLMAAVFSPCRAKTQRPEISPRHAAPSERLNRSWYPCAFCRNRAHLVVVCRYFVRSRYLIITTRICPRGASLGAHFAPFAVIHSDEEAPLIFHVGEMDRSICNVPW